MSSRTCSLCGTGNWRHSIPFTRETLCDSCFRRRFLERVRRTLNKLKLLNIESKLLLGVSGSCESLAMAKAIWKLESKYKGVQLSFVHVSRWDDHKEEEAIAGTFEKLGLPLNLLRTIQLKERFGFNLPDLVKDGIVSERELCSACQSLVSGALTIEAVRSGADILVCGDSADELAEEALSLLCVGRFRRMDEKKELLDGTIWCIRPLSHVLRTEAESFLDSYGIHAKYSCPYRGLRRREFAGSLRAIEEKHPGSVFSTLKSLLDLARS